MYMNSYLCMLDVSDSMIVHNFNALIFSNQENGETNILGYHYDELSPSLRLWVGTGL